jgi:hypothetical protein
MEVSMNPVKKTRNRRKQTVSLDERLRQAARSAGEAAALLPQGLERNVMLQKARQAETALRISGWLALPGQPFPK